MRLEGGSPKGACGERLWSKGAGASIVDGLDRHGTLAMLGDGLDHDLHPGPTLSASHSGDRGG